MKDRVKIALYAAIILVTLSITLLLFLSLPLCESCGQRFCFGNCSSENGSVEFPGLHPEWPDTNQTRVVLAETERADDAYLDKVYFVGDSRTNALQLNGIPLDHIFAEDGLNHARARTADVVKLDGARTVTIPEAVGITAPEIMIVNFGINGVAWMKEEEFFSEYKGLLEDLIERSPHSILVIESILPVSQSYTQKPEPDGVTNEKIDGYNRKLLQLAEEKGCYYMAANEAMKGGDNNLLPEFTEDGLHFTHSAYRTLLDYVMTHAIYVK